MDLKDVPYNYDSKPVSPPESGYSGAEHSQAVQNALRRYRLDAERKLRDDLSYRNELVASYMTVSDYFDEMVDALVSQSRDLEGNLIFPVKAENCITSALNDAIEHIAQELLDKRGTDWQDYEDLHDYEDE